jgi:hypothetical protein
MIRVCLLSSHLHMHFDFIYIAVEEMRLRGYSHLLLANNDVIIPPLAVPLMLHQLRESFDLIVPISSRHGSGFGSEACCLCPVGIVSARSWAVAAAELPLCAAAIQRRLARIPDESPLKPPYETVWEDSASGMPLPCLIQASHSNGPTLTRTLTLHSPSPTPARSSRCRALTRLLSRLLYGLESQRTALRPRRTPFF